MRRMRHWELRGQSKKRSSPKLSLWRPGKMDDARTFSALEHRLAERAVRLIQKDQLEMSDELQQHLAALKVHKIGAVRRDIGNLHGPGDFDG
jgi:hypothetical protein